ncbi:hypothetical protein [Pseudomonas sp. ATCC 13867]|uniref:hypothetical protein n=1 Tax=Pseudomonas sp. ATCC 13867 TaxID=1294143 RepID=UPI00034D3254|nr:hypothetical protein [Pseudomonas sp. ATCC 13867]
MDSLIERANVLQKASDVLRLLGQTGLVPIPELDRFGDLPALAQSAGVDRAKVSVLTG